MLLLINPKIDILKTENIKPILSVLVDNSLSTKYFKEVNKVKSLVKEVQNNNEINSKFNVQFFSFGNTINTLDSLSFNKTQTDIYNAVNSVNTLNKGILNSTILLSDGNQTKGNDYEFVKSNNKIFPVVVGDTTKYQDIEISQLNVNKYSYLNNKFPVEALIHYNGKKSIISVFTITYKGKKVFSKKIQLSPLHNTKTITTNLKSTKKGLQYYKASIRKIEQEKNIKNNFKNFSVEVIDEQTKILLLASHLHPDLGAIKKSIESNKQRKVKIALIDDKNIDFKAYQFFVLYQPNRYFNTFFDKISSNYLIISGKNTDWNFLNSLNIGVKKDAINQTENYNAVYNDTFLTFLQKDIGFNDFPPLLDSFGEIEFTGNHQALLYKKYVGISTNEPLLATVENNDKKYAVLFGEGIWKWRAASFLKEQSFEIFDAFLGNLTQYLASNKKRNRLEVKSNSIYSANDLITISAFYVDKNYKFDDRASLELTVTNTTTKKETTIPFSLVNNSYQVSIDNLNSGDYSYKVSVLNQKLTKYGKFKINDYQVEEQFTNANVGKLQTLANNSKGQLYYPNKIKDLLNNLIKDESYFTVQKAIKTQQNLINWQWILLLVIVLLSTEWFIRKYYGKI